MAIPLVGEVKEVGAGGGGVSTHDQLGGVTPNQHHPQAHAPESHTGQNATAAQLNELVGGSQTSLHAHAGSGGLDVWGKDVFHAGGFANWHNKSSVNGYYNARARDGFISSGSISGDWGRAALSGENGGFGVNFDKNPRFLTVVKFSATTNQEAFFTMGESKDAPVKYLGWKVVNNTLYAVHHNGTSETATVVAGITLTNWNRYEAIKSASDIKFYVNGSLVATHTANLPAGTNPMHADFRIMMNEAVEKRLNMALCWFQQDW